MASSEPILIGTGIGPLNPVSITLVGSGMAGSALSPVDAGIYSFPSQVGIGIAGLPQIAVRIGGTLNAVATLAIGIRNAPTMVAAANGDLLRGQYANVNTTPGAFTGVQAVGFEFNPFSVATFTTPADPYQVNIGAITGTGAVNAIAIRIAPPTGATNNYLIAHTTPATFNVTAAGGATFGAEVDLFGGANALVLKTSGAISFNNGNNNNGASINVPALNGTAMTISSSTVTTSGNLVVTSAFGCNGAAAQAAAASGGALAGYVSGAFGLDSNAHMLALFNLVVAMRAALVANGIMS